jgi:hypothetical protein
MCLEELGRFNLPTRHQTPFAKGGLAVDTYV